MKTLIILLAVLSLNACGSDETSRPGTPIIIASDAKFIEPAFDQDCLDGKPIVSQPKEVSEVSFCKQLKDGTVSTITVKRGEDRVDPVSCAVTYEGKGLTDTLREMNYAECR